MTLSFSSVETNAKKIFLVCLAACLFSLHPAFAFSEVQINSAQIFLKADAASSFAPILDAEEVLWVHGADGDFSASSSDFRVAVQLEVGSSWSLEFAVPTLTFPDTAFDPEMKLGVGFYENPTLLPLLVQYGGGMNVTSGSIQLQEIGGWFDVVESEYEDGVITKLAIDFRQLENSEFLIDTPSLYGSLRINSDIPLNTSGISLTNPDPTLISASPLLTPILDFEGLEDSVSAGAALQLLVSECTAPSTCLTEGRLGLLNGEERRDRNAHPINLSYATVDPYVQTAISADHSTPYFVPYIESYAYTEGPYLIQALASALQSYRFNRDGVQAANVSLSYSQSGVDSTNYSLGFAEVAVFVFRVANDELFLNSCNQLTNYGTLADTSRFGLCLAGIARGSSSSIEFEVDGLMDLQTIIVTGDTSPHPAVANQSVVKEFEIQGAEGDVVYVLALNASIANTDGFVEVNNFTLSLGSVSGNTDFKYYETTDLASRTVVTDAQYSNENLSVPLIQVDEQFFNAEFSIVPDSDPLQIRLVSATELFNVDGQEIATFQEEILTVPSIVYNDVLYTAQFRLIDNDSLIFELVSSDSK
ncbi:MAG: hypothetical protein GKR91_06005 [Pseudomonadales bacterium]|nr:hypothetical protein [Pseudomonadales bacterium]